TALLLYGPVGPVASLVNAARSQPACFPQSSASSSAVAGWPLASPRPLPPRPSAASYGVRPWASRRSTRAPRSTRNETTSFHPHEAAPCSAVCPVRPPPRLPPGPVTCG